MINQNTIYIGTLSLVDKDLDCTRFKFKRPLNYSVKAIEDLGPVVYLMYVGKTLMKIGKAAGARGWEGRLCMYGNGTTSRGDKTNARMRRELKKIDESEIDVYAYPIAKSNVTYRCPFTNEQVTDSIEVASLLETRLIDLAVGKGYKLPFCNIKGH
jgi:hypothetical protein